MEGVWSRSNAALYARMVLLAQLSDTHLLADPGTRLWDHNTTHNLAAVMDALPLRVDVLVVSGDVAEDGSREAYRRALSLTAGRARHRYFLAGNHDDPNVMREVFGPVQPLRMVEISDRWTMALIDSQWVGHEEGRLTDETLVRLRDELARAETNLVLCLHHPPISPCKNRACGLSSSEPLQEIIQNGPVRLVMSGHVHQQFDTLHKGVRFVGAPSTFRQLRHGGDPHYTDTLEPPAAQLFELFDDGEVTCRVVCADEIDTDSRLM
jgi:Icc protein